MTSANDQLKAKIRSMYDWYSKSPHGCSERFNDGRLSALCELLDWIRHEESAPEACPDWCENPSHKTSEVRPK
jgi:hypothetical protein